MEVQPDFKELLALFNAHGVEYLIVGGYALAHHGAPRFTGDLDLWVHSRTENAQRILARWMNSASAHSTCRQRILLRKTMSCSSVCRRCGWTSSLRLTGSRGPQVGRGARPGRMAVCRCSTLGNSMINGHRQGLAPQTARFSGRIHLNTSTKRCERKTPRCSQTNRTTKRDYNRRQAQLAPRLAETSTVRGGGLQDRRRRLKAAS